MQVFSKGIGGIASQIYAAAHTVGLLVILDWTGSGDSLVPRTESKGDLRVLCHTEQNLWCWDKLREPDQLPQCCDLSRAGGSEKVSEEREEKQCEKELRKALW